MRICSFLPSATEILFALGLEDSVAGVTFECDYPPAACRKPIVVDSLLGDGLSSQEIDRRVSECSANGDSLYRVNSKLLEQIQPDLIITQELCGVCAVSASHLLASVQNLPIQPRVISLTPHTLEDVWSDIERIGSATGREVQARALVTQIRQKLDNIRQRRTRTNPRVACLEWLNPPFNAGHWVPEMVALAGGIDVLGTAGIDSARIRWEDVITARPDIILIMPCGYDLPGVLNEVRSTRLASEWVHLPAVRSGRVFAVNATAYFSRPGPRLIDGLEIISALFRDDFTHPLPPDSWTRLTSQLFTLSGTALQQPANDREIAQTTHKESAAEKYSLPSLK